MSARLSLSKRRAIAAALDAHELTWREIKATLGVSLDAIAFVADELRQAIDTPNSAATDGLPRTVALRGQGNMP